MCTSNRRKDLSSTPGRSDAVDISLDLVCKYVMKYLQNLLLAHSCQLISVTVEVCTLHLGDRVLISTIPQAVIIESGELDMLLHSEVLSNDKLQCLGDSRPDKRYVNEVDVQGRKRAGQQYGKGKAVLEGRS